MQITIDFISDEDIILPVHYNSTLQGFIYNNINKELADFLHEEGYSYENRSFKLFTFSRILKFGEKVGDYLNFGKSIRIKVSSPIEEFCTSLTNHMLVTDNLQIGKNIVKVRNIEVNKNKIEDNKIKIKTLSPIVAYSTIIKKNNKKYTHYYRVGDKDFARIISENLRKKYKALYDLDLDADNLKIVSLKKPRQNLTYYRNTIIKGMSGEFLIEGDKRLLQIGIDSGFGSKNSQGFGLVDEVK